MTTRILCFIALVLFIAAPTKAQKHDPSPPCKALEEARSIHDTDGCYYNGVTFAEWEKFQKALDAATSSCKARNWQGKAKWWDVYFHEWVEMSCKSFKKPEHE